MSDPIWIMIGTQTIILVWHFFSKANHASAINHRT